MADFFDTDFYDQVISLDGNHFKSCRFYDCGFELRDPNKIGSLDEKCTILNERARLAISLPPGIAQGAQLHQSLAMAQNRAIQIVHHSHQDVSERLANIVQMHKTKPKLNQDDPDNDEGERIETGDPIRDAISARAGKYDFDIVSLLSMFVELSRQLGGGTPHDNLQRLVGVKMLLELMCGEGYFVVGLDDSRPFSIVNERGEQLNLTTHSLPAIYDAVVDNLMGNNEGEET